MLVDSLDQANRQLLDDIALSVIEANFDESRSMEYLRSIRESLYHADTPVVMARFRDCMHSEVLRHTFAVMKNSGTICAYVESDGDNEAFRTRLSQVVEDELVLNHKN